MSKTPVEIVERFLEHAADPAIVNELIAADATIVSLNYENKELQRILPWTGTYKGPQAFMGAFHRMFAYWESLDYHVKEVFGAGENVAAFGSFSYRSNTLAKTATSPFSAWAKVKNGKIVYFQYMEDTYATAETFKAGGSWRIHSDPEGKPFEI